MSMLRVIETVPAFLQGGGTMGALIRAHDWTATPLGPVAAWPAPLRAALAICLHSSFPTAIYWGPELRLLYNDAWSHIPAERHPWALGRPAAAVWRDIWPVVGPQFDHVLRRGEGVSAFDQPLAMARAGTIEETWWNYSFTPILAEDGTVAGVFNQGNETTARVLEERRLAFRLDLEDRLRDMRDATAIARVVSEALGRHLGVGQAGFAEVEGCGVMRAGTGFRQDQPGEAAGGPAAPCLDAAAMRKLAAGQVIAIEDTAQRLASPSGPRALLAAPLMRHGRLTCVLHASQAAPRRWTAAEVALLRDVAERAAAAIGRARAEAALAESEARFRALADSAPVIVWTTDREGLCTWLSAGWYALTGQTEAEALGLGWTTAVHPEDRPAVAEGFLAAARDGRPFGAEYRLRAADGRYRWALDTATPRHDAAGCRLGYVGSVIDITERRTMEERQGLLAREVEHRAKNALAVVLAALRLTRAETVAEYRAVLEGRIATLARAQVLLGSGRWDDGTDLATLIEGELAAFLGTGEAAPGLRARLDGPPVALPAAATQPMAMALHELATNAVKHGALSTPGGAVSLRWHAEAGPGPGQILRLRWAESGGPPVRQPPQRRGFGTRVLDGTVRAQLGGSVALEWRPEGLVCDIAVPLGRAAAAQPGDAAA